MPVGEREDYRDIEPVTQDEGPYPVVPIAYTTACTKCCKTRCVGYELSQITYDCR